MKHIALFSFALLISSLLISQEIAVVRDAGLWAGIGVGKRITKDFQAEFNQELRLYHNCTKIDDCISDLGIDYSINRNFSIGANGRYTYNIKRDEVIENDLRYGFDMNYKARLGLRFKLFCRARYSKEYFDAFNKISQEKLTETDFRYRLKLEYQYNGMHSLYTSGEIFRTTDKLRDPYFSKIRCFAGDEIRIQSGVLNLAIGYELQNKISYRTSFVFMAISYTLKL
ncbi:MAG TPA: DUF2490 domain-containing protein [Bacteroidales bacterium]|nr:DUF2490 domain-containing protein [Bacteroidales bacterium]